MDWNQNTPSSAEWDEGMYGDIRMRGARAPHDPLYASRP